MPYRRSYKRRGRYGGRRRNKNRKVSVYTRKGARSQAKQIWRNQSQISAMQSKMKETYTRNFYELTGAKAQTVKPGVVFPLIKPDGWDRIFSTQLRPTTATSTHCRVGNIKIRGIMQIEAGDAVVSCDVYVLQLKEATAAVTRDNLGASLENLMQTGTTSGMAVWNNYYFTNFGNANLEGPTGNMLNPDAFKVRGHRRFMIGDVPYSEVASEATAVTNLRDANKQFEFNLSHPIKLKNPLGANQTGTALSWKTLTVDQIAPHKQLYLAVFVNAVEGTQVFLNWNSVITTFEPS